MNWDTNEKDSVLIKKIAGRAVEMFEGYKFFDAILDLTACHMNGCPLDLKALLKAKKSDFIHDITGINRYLNHVTGELEAGFVPRYAIKKQE